MKRLKYRCAFCGYGQWVAVVSMTLCLVWFSVYVWLEMSNMDVPPAPVAYTVFGACMLLPPLAAWLWLHFHLNREERQLVAEAQPPEWQPLSQRDYDHFRAEGYFSRFLGVYVWLGLLAVFVISYMLVVPEAMPLFVAFWIIAGVIILLTLLDHHFWQYMDETAECAEIPVEHSYSRKIQVRFSSYTHYYLVCYLPDGKYILHDEQSYGCASSIRVIRYKHRIRWYPTPTPPQLW